MRRARSIAWGLMCLTSTACPGRPTGDSATDSSSGTTTDAGTTGAPTTGAAVTTTGSGLTAACEGLAAAALHDHQVYCPCAVELGLHPDVATCLASYERDDRTYIDCVCTLEIAETTHAEYITCITDAEVAYTTCVTPLSCQELQGEMEWACFGAYLAARAACGKAFLASTLAVESECHDLPPFTCGSGELVPYSYTCDGVADCIDMSDEADKLCQG